MHQQKPPHELRQEWRSPTHNHGASSRLYYDNNIAGVSGLRHLACEDLSQNRNGNVRVTRLPTFNDYQPHDRVHRNVAANRFSPPLCTVNPQMGRCACDGSAQRNPSLNMQHTDNQKPQFEGLNSEIIRQVTLTIPSKCSDHVHRPNTRKVESILAEMQDLNKMKAEAKELRDALASVKRQVKQIDGKVSSKNVPSRYLRPGTKINNPRLDSASVTNNPQKCSEKMWQLALKELCSGVGALGLAVCKMVGITGRGALSVCANISSTAEANCSVPHNHSSSLFGALQKETSRERYRRHVTPARKQKPSSEQPKNRNKERGRQFKESAKHLRECERYRRGLEINQKSYEPKKRHNFNDHVSSCSETALESDTEPTCSDFSTESKIGCDSDYDFSPYISSESITVETESSLDLEESGFDVGKYGISSSDSSYSIPVWRNSVNTWQASPSIDPQRQHIYKNCHCYAGAPNETETGYCKPMTFSTMKDAENIKERVLSRRSNAVEPSRIRGTVPLPCGRLPQAGGSSVHNEPKNFDVPSTFSLSKTARRHVRIDIDSEDNLSEQGDVGTQNTVGNRSAMGDSLDRAGFTISRDFGNFQGGKAEASLLSNIENTKTENATKQSKIFNADDPKEDLEKIEEGTLQSETTTKADNAANSAKKCPADVPVTDNDSRNATTDQKPDRKRSFFFGKTHRIKKHIP